MYSTKKDSITVKVQVHMWHKKTETKALLDSGATHNFIDKQVVETLGLGTRKLSQTLEVSNVDRTTNPITKFCNYGFAKESKPSNWGSM
jgi:hypothetical protein